MDEEVLVPIQVPLRARPQNKEKRDCDCMNREYLLKYKTGVMHWCCRVGDSVCAGDIVCEAEIEKKIFEIPSPVDGILAECCVAEEEEFKCNLVLGYVRIEG